LNDNRVQWVSYGQFTYLEVGGPGGTFLYQTQIPSVQVVDVTIDKWAGKFNFTNVDVSVMPHRDVIWSALNHSHHELVKFVRNIPPMLGPMELPNYIPSWVIPVVLIMISSLLGISVHVFYRFWIGKTTLCIPGRRAARALLEKVKNDLENAPYLAWYWDHFNDWYVGGIKEKKMGKSPGPSRKSMTSRVTVHKAKYSSPATSAIESAPSSPEDQKVLIKMESEDSQASKNPIRNRNRAFPRVTFRNRVPYSPSSSDDTQINFIKKQNPYVLVLSQQKNSDTKAGGHPAPVAPLKFISSENSTSFEQWLENSSEDSFIDLSQATAQKSVVTEEKLTETSTVSNVCVIDRQPAGGHSTSRIISAASASNQYDDGVQPGHPEPNAPPWEEAPHVPDGPPAPPGHLPSVLVHDLPYYQPAHPMLHPSYPPPVPTLLPSPTPTSSYGNLPLPSGYVRPLPCS
jgi:hypothetical protein